MIIFLFRQHLMSLLLGKFFVFRILYLMLMVCFFSHRTVWYEILYRDWPWVVRESGSTVLLPPEVIIWQVGRGVKPALSNLQAVKDVKVSFLITCYSFFKY